MLNGSSRLRALAASVVLTSALASCAGTEDPAVQGSPTPSPTVTPTVSPTPAQTCEERGRTTLRLVAKNFRFNARCLVFPAGKPVSIEFENRDRGPLAANHNFSIYTLEFSSLFTGELAFPNEHLTYKVPGLEAGAYLFQCDIHPRDMSGPLIVR